MAALPEKSEESETMEGVESGAPATSEKNQKAAPQDPKTAQAKGGTPGGGGGGKKKKGKKR